MAKSQHSTLVDPEGAAAQADLMVSQTISPRARVGLVILGVLALVWISTLPRLVKPMRAGLPPVPGPMASRADRQAPIDLQTAVLNRQVPVFAPGRNIFAFDSPSRAVIRSIGEGQKRQGTRQGEKAQVQPPQDSGLEMSFLGVFGPERLRVAVLKDKDDSRVSNLVEQDMVEGRYRVLEIDPQSILLRDTSSPEGTAIRLEVP